MESSTITMPGRTVHQILAGPNVWTLDMTLANADLQDGKNLESNKHMKYLEEPMRCMRMPCALRKPLGGLQGCGL